MATTLIPTKIVPGKWWKTPEIKPISKLRPKPIRHTLLIVGDGKSIWDDLIKFRAMGADHDTMLLNHTVMAYPYPYQHYAVGDSHRAYEQEIARKYVPRGVIKHCWNPNSHGFDVRWIKQTPRGWEGTTLSLAVRVGIILGYLKIVLAGCPMDNSGHWYNEFLKPDDNKLKNEHKHHLWKWMEMACRPYARLMRSMSGNTQELFGEPTVEWLFDIPQPLNGRVL